MLYVALAVVIATAIGVACERRGRWAMPVARACLGTMLYVLVPYISFVNFAHLHLSASGGVGILLAYVALGITGVLAWWLGRRVLHLPSASVGALICSTIILNTGYLGLPMGIAILGTRHLSSAIAYDQLVSSAMLLIVGFAIGAIFGERGGETPRARVRSYLVRNPPLLAVIAGLIVPASAVPNTLVHISHLVVVILLPLGFFVVGVHLSAERREDHATLLDRPDRRILAAVGLRLIVEPLILAIVSLSVIRLPSAYILQAAMPTGINSLIVGHAYGLDQRLIATVIVWSTMLVVVVGLVAGAV